MKLYGELTLTQLYKEAEFTDILDRYFVPPSTLNGKETKIEMQEQDGDDSWLPANTPRHVYRRMRYSS